MFGIMMIWYNTAQWRCGGGNYLVFCNVKNLGTNFRALDFEIALALWHPIQCLSPPALPPPHPALPPPRPALPCSAPPLPHKWTAKQIKSGIGCYHTVTLSLVFSHRFFCVQKCNINSVWGWNEMKWIQINRLSHKSNPPPPPPPSDSAAPSSLLFSSLDDDVTPLATR